MSGDDMGVPASPSGHSRAEPEEVSALRASVPNALENISAIPAGFGGNFSASIAISLKRIADMMEEDRKPRLELLPEGHITDQDHRRFVRDMCVRDSAAWEAIADAATYIAGRMPLPASAIEARRAATENTGAVHESAAREAGDAR